MVIKRRDTWYANASVQGKWWLIANSCTTSFIRIPCTVQRGGSQGSILGPLAFSAHNSILIKVLLANPCHFPNAPAITHTLTQALQLMPLLERYYSFPHVNSWRVESAEDNLLQNKTCELPIQVQRGKRLRFLIACLICITLTLWGKSNWQTATNLFACIGQYISLTNFELQNHIRMLKISQCFLYCIRQHALFREVLSRWDLISIAFSACSSLY